MLFLPGALWAMLEAVCFLQTMLLISEFSEMSIVGKELCRDQRGEGGTETSL